MEVPKEVIFRHAYRTAADYFAGRIAEKRRAGFVPVFVEDTYETLYYMPCDERGYPQTHMMHYLELPRLSAEFMIRDMASVDTTQTVTVQEITVSVDYPMLSQRYDWQEKPIVFMWHGKRIDVHNVPVEKLNVSELMRIAQKAVKEREGLVIDEALKNKVYK